MRMETAKDYLAFSSLCEMQQNGRDVAAVENQLQGFEVALTPMLQHRDIIVKNIADIDRAEVAPRSS
jgi:hypothetical protein